MPYYAHAGFLNYCVMKVSRGNSRKFIKPLSKPVMLKNKDVGTVSLMVPNRNIVTDTLLGTERNVQTTLTGTDEVGRKLKVKLK